MGADRLESPGASAPNLLRHLWIRGTLQPVNTPRRANHKARLSPDSTIRRLLIVDDDRDVTAALKLGLERKGMQVATFNDPSKALEALKNRHHYDLVITDIRMPKMSGFELYREVRKHDGETPIVFMTAFDIDQKEFVMLFPDVRPKALLRKPIGIAELAAHIDELLEGKEEAGPA